MSSSTKKVVYIENMHKVTPTELAEYLTYGTGYSWRRLEVVFLYNKLQTSRPLYAAVRMPNVMYPACSEKHCTVICGHTLKISELAEHCKIQMVRWIRFMNGTRISVTGTKHWSLDLDTEVECNEDRAAVRCRFYDWDKLELKGGESFCYAVVDCGTGIQEKRDRGYPQIDILVEKMVEAGVQRMVLKGSSIKKAERAKALAALYPDLMGFSVGYHPCLADAWNPDKLTTLKQLAGDPACVAIGECGLSSLGSTDSLDRQKELLKVQVEMACELHKPLLIVEEKAQTILLKILQGFQGQLPPVAIRPVSMASCDPGLYVQHGFYIVVTGSLFTGDSYNSPFFTWLRHAEQWQLDHLLLASSYPDRKLYPNFVDKVLLVELQRVIQKVRQDHYSPAALAWLKGSGEQLSRNMPLYLPILVELVADGVSLSPAALASKCLENSKRFFQVIDRPCLVVPQATSRKVGFGWRLAKELGPFAISVAAIFVCMYFVCLCPSYDMYFHFLD